MKKFLKNIAEKTYKHFGDDSGHMLLLTSILGIAMSSLAQTAAIILNKKYTTSQKAFMIPQELTEGMVTVFSIFVITKPLQKMTKRYMHTGKLLTKNLAKYMKDNNLLEKRGKTDFDLKQSINEIISNIEKSDKFIKASSKEQEIMLSTHQKAKNDFDITLDAASAIATTAGGVFSTALVAPILRNHSASNYQRLNMNTLKNMEEKRGQSQAPTFKANPLKHYNGLRL